MKITSYKNPVHKQSFTAELAPETLSKLEASIIPQQKQTLEFYKKQLEQLGNKHTVIRLVDSTNLEQRNLFPNKRLNQGVYALFTNKLAPQLPMVKVFVSEKFAISLNTLLSISKYTVKAGETKLCKPMLESGQFQTPEQYFASLEPKNQDKFIARILKRIKL